MKEYAVVDYFEYNENSPSKLVWKVSRGVGIKAGEVVGWQDQKTKYYRVKIDDKCYQIHRVIYAMFNKDVKQDAVIDHIDRDRSNNSIKNLRITDSYGNSQNKSKYKNNASGTTGVSYRKDGRFVVQWYENDKLNSKSFSTNKYGFELSKELAENFRIEIIEQLNQNGASYTGEHGL